MKFFLIFILTLITVEAQKVRVYIGTHESEDAKGIYVSDLDSKSGLLSKPVLIAARPGAKIVKSGSSDRLFACGAEKANSYKDGKLSGSVNVGRNPCYISIDNTGEWMFTADISGGTVSCVSLSEGAVKVTKSIMEVPPAKNGKVKPHAIVVSPDNRNLILADIGGKRICILGFNDKTGEMTFLKDIYSENFVGPRHFTFSKDGRFGYLMNQMGGAVTVFEWKSGNLKEIQHISALPKDFNGKVHSASIVFHPNGRFLYCSNRGPDSLTLFHQDSNTGKLEYKGVVSSGGGSPWSFDITKDGKYLICSNRNSNNLVSYPLNQDSGEIGKAISTVEVPLPSSVSIVK